MSGRPGRIAPAIAHSLLTRGMEGDPARRPLGGAFIKPVPAPDGQPFDAVIAQSPV